MNIRHPFSFACAAVMSMGAWYVFYPAIMPQDSIYMYLDAVRGEYSDLHPVFLPFVLSLVFQLGGHLGLVMLCSAWMGVYGTRRLIINLMTLVTGHSNGWIDLTTVFLLILLFSPLTLAAVYFMTLWTDTWLTICLAWAISF